MIGNRKVRLALDHKAYGSLSKAPDIEEAIEYLEANGFEGGVLSTVSVDFRKGEQEEADRLAETITNMTGKNPSMARNLPHSTLQAFVKQAFSNDKNFDVAKVGCSMVRMAKFTVS
jgi:hypothetical protein